MAKVSLTSQIAAVQVVVNGQILTRPAAALHREHMAAALDTLKWMQRHEADIRAFVDARKGSAA